MNLLLLLLLVATAVAECPLRIHTEVHSSNDAFFDALLGINGGTYPVQQTGTSSIAITVAEISRLLLSAQRKLVTLCGTYSNRQMVETYLPRYYQLQVSLTEFTESNIKVRAQQRLVWVEASDCSAEYATARILPDVVDASHAAWKFNRGVLTIMFPYKVTPTAQLNRQCGRPVSETLLMIPRMSEFLNTNDDISIGVSEDQGQSQQGMFASLFNENRGQTVTEKTLDYVD